MKREQRAPRGVTARTATGLVVCALAVLGGAPQIPMTEARWVDAESAGAGFTALTVPMPSSGGACQINGSLLNLLGSSLTLHWKLPAGSLISHARISYTGANGLVPVTDTLTGTELKTTLSGDTYTTVITGGLLSATLGGTRVLSVQMQHASGWISQPRTVTGVWPALALGQATCSTTPAA